MTHSYRRNVLLGSAAVLTTSLLSSLAKASLTVVKEKDDWRYCGKCYVAFYSDGEKRTCVTGGQHQAQGYSYVLTYDEDETKTAQTHWRQCRTCSALFFNGSGRRGRCSVSSQGHVPDLDLNYTLSHSTPGTSTHQPEWRYCSKCSSLFYDGLEQKGRCPAGGGHTAQGFNFVLAHKKSDFIVPKSKPRA